MPDDGSDESTHATVDWGEDEPPAARVISHPSIIPTIATRGRMNAGNEGRSRTGGGFEGSGHAPGSVDVTRSALAAIPDDGR